MGGGIKLFIVVKVLSGYNSVLDVQNLYIKYTNVLFDCLHLMFELHVYFECPLTECLN